MCAQVSLARRQLHGEVDPQQPHNGLPLASTATARQSEEGLDSVTRVTETGVF